MLDDPERSPGTDVEVPEPVPSALWGGALPVNSRPLPSRNPSEEHTRGQRGRARNRTVHGDHRVVDEHGQRGIPPSAVLQGIIENERIAGEYVGRDTTMNRQPAQHRTAPEDGGQERARRQREDEEDQVHLLDQPRDQERKADDEVHQPFTGQDRSLGRPQRAQKPLGETSKPASRPTMTRFVFDVHRSPLPAENTPSIPKWFDPP